MIATEPELMIPEHRAIGKGEMEMRSFAMTFAGLMIFTAIAAMAGCTPTSSAGQVYACPAGVPWVPDGYTNGKFVPAHCLGEPAK